MAFDKETAITANKFYTNGKGMYMLLFDNYSVITSGTSEGPTDDVYLKTESGNPVGAEWTDAVTNEPVSLVVSAGATIIPFTGLVKSPEGAISIVKGSSIELSVQPQPTDTTDSITYNWSVDDSYLSYLADNNKCIITGVAAGSTTVTVTPVVNGTVDASKAVSFATTVNVVVPTLTINSTSCQLPSMTAGVVMSAYNIVDGCQISISNGGTLAFEVRSTLPEGLSFDSGIFTGTPTTAGNGTIEVYVYPYGYYDSGVTITAIYTIAEASVAFTGLNKITANPSVKAGDSITLELSILPENCTDSVSISWTTSDSNYTVTPSANGLSATVEFLAAGNFEIYATPVVNGNTHSDSYISWYCQVAESEAGDSNAASYNVTATHWTANEQYTKFNGTYSLITTTTGTEAVYKNENGCVMKWANGTWGWSFFTDETSSYPTFITYEISADPANANNKTTWWNEAAVVEFPAGTITLVTDEGGSDSGSTEETTYLYTVSGCSTESANGHYYETGETFNGAKTYTNGSCYIFYDLNLLAWYLSAHKNNTTNAPIATCFSEDTTQVPTSGWSDGVTVSVYGGGSSGGGTSTADYIVTDAGSTEANGEYFATGESRTIDGYGTFPIYKNSNNVYLYFSSQCGYSWMPGWCLSPNVIDSGDGMLYCTQCGEGASQYPTGMLESWSSLDGVSPYPKCYACDENGEPIIPPDYIVSGAGSAAVNGDYVSTGTTYNGYPVYMNENNIILWYYTMMGGWVFSDKDNYTEDSAYWYYSHSYGSSIINDYWIVSGKGISPVPTIVEG